MFSEFTLKLIKIVLFKEPEAAFPFYPILKPWMHHFISRDNRIPSKRCHLKEKRSIGKLPSVLMQTALSNDVIVTLKIIRTAIKLNRKLFFNSMIDHVS